MGVVAALNSYMGQHMQRANVMTVDMRGCFWEKLRLAEPSGSFLVGSSHCSQYSGARNWFCLCFQRAQDFAGPIHPSEIHKRLLGNQDAFFFFLAFREGHACPETQIFVSVLRVILSLKDRESKPSQHFAWWILNQRKGYWVLGGRLP